MAEQRHPVVSVEDLYLSSSRPLRFGEHEVEIHLQHFPFFWAETVHVLQRTKEIDRGISANAPNDGSDKIREAQWTWKNGGLQ
ncbi:hypothetical protein ACOMHN_002354 [Nucella lapillus]